MFVAASLTGNIKLNVMSIKRKLVRIESPKSQPGFLGAGHMARPVITGSYSDSDPFILLMDDMLDKKNDEPVGGPHPHAGFETVSYLLEGEIGDDEYKMNAGDFQIMTAGSGIVHTETIDKIARMRLLQLWVTLPKKDRWAKPRIQHLPLEHVPAESKNGVSIRLYSGKLNGLQSPVQNYVPMMVADIALEGGVSTTQLIPANYNTFLYVLHGSVKVGEDARELTEAQVGWLNLFASTDDSELILSAGEGGVRFVLYGGQPTGENIVSHGPFIGDTNEDILRLYHDYRQGDLKHISTVPANQKIIL